jgi:hypothetical protein
MPYKDPDKKAAWERERRGHRPNAKNRRRATETSPLSMPRAWCGLDGEGADDPNGRHHYLIMIAGNDTEQHVLYTGQPLTTLECLGWLCDLPADLRLVGFSLGYDWTKILTDLPPESLDLLYHPDKRLGPNRRPRPIVWKGFKLDLEGTRMRICRAGQSGRIIWDVFHFFNRNFIQVADDFDAWASPEERALVVMEKEQRGTYTVETARRAAERLIAYSTIECQVLTRVVDQLNTTATELGYPLRAWYGAGSLADAMITRHKPGEHRGTLPAPLFDAACDGYYGGRFETAGVGEIEGDTFEYDLNAAYVWALTQLPCLACGTWVHHTDNNLHGPWTVYRLNFTTKHPERRWQPFPYRTRACSVVFAQAAAGWYWHPEVHTAITGLDEQPDIAESWEFIRGCDHEPFAFVRDVYEKRRAIAASSPRGKRDMRVEVLKTGQNSIYGKTVQSVGAGSPISSPVWGGLITSLIRARILEAIAQDSDAVIAVATDGIMTTRPLDLPCSDGLGDWELHTYARGFWAQTGVYALWDHDGRVKLRSRGFHERTFRDAVDDMVECWLDGTETFPISETQFVNIKAALARRNYNDIVGQWLERTLQIRLLPQAKRTTAHRHSKTPYVMLPTLPASVITGESHPYPHTNRWRTVVPTKP